VKEETWRSFAWTRAVQQFKDIIIIECVRKLRTIIIVLWHCKTMEKHIMGLVFLFF